MIGSQILMSFPDFDRKANDVDYLVEEIPEDWESKRIDLHVNPVLWEFVPNDCRRIDVQTLYTLKCSHIFWNIKWQKHIHDIKFMNQKDIELNMELFNKLFTYWEQKHGKRRTPDFDKDNSEFFDDNVDREFEHDELHKIVAYPDQPVFDSIKQDTSKANVDQELFESLSEENKIRMIKEEAYVLAIERYLLHNKGIPKLVAYKRVLKKLLMGLTPLWMALWMAQNYHLIDMPDPEFYDNFKQNKSIVQ